MKEERNHFKIKDLLWALALGVGLTLLLVWTMMPRSSAQAQDVRPGFTVDLAYNSVWGMLNPGDTVSMDRTTGGLAHSASEADGVGFFWAPLWQSDGQPADVVGGDALQVDVNGAFAATLTPADITGHVDVLSDTVVGNIAGAGNGTPVTVTIGAWAYSPGMRDNVQVTTVTGGGSGDFVANFSPHDLGPYHYARVEYSEGDGLVQDYLYPEQVFHVDTFSHVFGYAEPGQTVTVTLERGSVPLTPTTATAEWPHGNYWVEADVQYGDIVEVDLGGGTIITTTAYELTAHPNAALDQVIGTCPPGALVHVWAWDWGLGRYAETSTIADGSGHYTATFAGHDLKASDVVYPYFADGEGDEVLLTTRPPQVSVDLDYNKVRGFVDGPDLPVTITLNTGSDTFSTSVWSDAANYVSWVQFGDPAKDIQPGHVITVESPGWTGVMTVADLSIEFDTANDQVMGTADIPGWVRIRARQLWDSAYRVHGQATISATVSSPFNASFTDFDLRDGCWATLTHYDGNDFATIATRETRRFEVHGDDGVWLPQFSATDLLTATLYESDGMTVKSQTSEDQDTNSDGYWLDMYDQIRPGDWVTVTDGAGWTAGLQVPSLSLLVDDASDLVWGTGPAALIHIEREWAGGWDQQFIPGPAYAFDTAFFGHDLQWGDTVVASYQAVNGNLVRRWFGWPQIFAHYDRAGWNKVWGYASAPSETVSITVTHPVSGVIAAGSATAGACSWCESEQYQLEFPDGAIAPGNVVTVSFGSGLVDRVNVLPLNAEVDVGADLVTVTAPTGTPVSMNASDLYDSWSSDEQIVGAIGTVVFDPGADGYDIIPGTSFNVHSRQAHGHNTQYSFWLPAPNLHVSKWNPGASARPDGVMVYGVYYHNLGDATAEGVQIVDVLPAYTSYVEDTGGFPHIEAGNVVTWTLGDLAPGEQGTFMVTLGVLNTAPTGSEVIPSNCVSITTTTPGDSDPDNNQYCAGPVDVWDDEIEFSVDKWVWPTDPAPGEEMIYTIQWCNDRDTAAGPVWLTDTLPLYTSLVSWEPEYWHETFWTEVMTTGGQVVLYAPGLPGYKCQNLVFTLALDPAAPVGTMLENSVVLDVPGDIALWNNEDIDRNAHVGEPRYDLRVHKSVHAEVSAPGGWINYFVEYYNDGNAAIPVRITDTVPSGLIYEYAHWGGDQPNANAPLPDPTITGDQLVWDLGMLEVGGGRWFHIQMGITDTLAPGATIVNCASGGLDGEEDSPWDNSECVTRTLNSPGPNLRVTKWHTWQGDEALSYQIRFENVGNQTINHVWVTDTLPISTTWSGWWDLDSSGWDRYVTYTGSSDEVAWLFSQLDPGDYGTIYLDANLDQPGVLMRWYTNTVEISTPPGDVNPDDNYEDDLAFSGAAQLEVLVQTPDGNPVTGYVELWNDGGYYHTDNSSPAIPAQFGDLEPGSYLVRAWPAFSDRPALANSKIVPVAIGEGLETLTLMLQSPNVIGAVQDPMGNPLPLAYQADGSVAPYPAAVNFHNEDYTVDLWVATAISGQFGLALPEGNYDLRAHPNLNTNLAYTYTRSSWNSFDAPPAGATIDLGNIRLGYPRVRGVVVTPEGERVSTWVSLWSDQGYGDGDDTYWYGEGHSDNKPFTFGGLPDGHYYVQAEPPWTNPEGYGYSTIHEFDVPPTSTEAITLVLQAANFVGDLLYPPDSDCPYCPVQWVDARVHNADWTFEAWATTGEDGRFTFSGLEAGVVYTVEVFLDESMQMDWLPPDPITFAINTSGGQYTSTLYLQPALRTKRVVGDVVYEDGTPVGDENGDGIGDALVYAYQENTGRRVDTKNDPDGSYDMYLSEGVWKIGVEPTHPGVDWIFDPSWEQWVVFSGTVPATQTVFLTVTQTTFFSVTGVITTPDGSPIAPQTVGVDLCTNEGDCFGAPVKSDGSFFIRALPGVYEVWVHVKPGLGFAPPVENGDLIFVNEDKEIGPYRLRARSTSLSGRVILASTSQGMSGVKIEAWTDSGDWVSTQTGNDGWYTLNLIPGHWHVRPVLSTAQEETYFIWPPQSRAGYLAAGETATDINFSLRVRNASIRGQVTDDQGSLLTTVNGVVYAEYCTAAKCWTISEAVAQGGTFELRVIGGYTYSVGIWLPTGGYVPGPDVPVEVFVDPWETRTGVVLQLIEAGTRIWGELHDGESGELVQIEAEVYGSSSTGQWAEDSLWPGKDPYQYNLYAITPETGAITWTLSLGVDPRSGYIADPSRPSYEVVVSDQQMVWQPLLVKKLDTEITGTVTAGGFPVPYILVYAEGKPGTDSEGLFFEAEVAGNGTFSIYVLPGEYLVGAYLPPHLAADYLPPQPQDWASTGDSPVELVFSSRAGQDLTISGALAVSPTGTLSDDVSVKIFGWSEDGSVSEITGTLSDGYHLPVVADDRWHVWAVYEDPVTNAFYASEEQEVDVGSVNVTDVDLTLEMAGFDLPDSECWTFDPTRFKRLSLPAWNDLPEPLVEIQAGTMPVTGTVQICATPKMAVPNGHYLIGFAYELEARDDAGNLITEDFDNKVRFIFYFDQNALPPDASIEDLQVAYYSTVRQEWVALDDVYIDDEDMFATGKVNHFSKFGAMSPPSSEGEGTVKLTSVNVNGPQTGGVGVAHTFTATVMPSSVTGSITYVWQSTGLPATVEHVGQGISDTATFSWSVASPQYITVTATDAYGGSDVETHPITIGAPCDPVNEPAFDFAPAQPLVGDVVVFTGTVLSGQTPTYTWDFGDGGVGRGEVVTHTFPITTTRKVYTVTMTAENDCPSQQSTSDEVTVWPRRIYLPLVLRN